ncbi:hypothetical protein TNCV_1931231 [Trichonephila clavipes]|nr:hypothetical protein TNCV_1931231 [Trichonephila clavipes]
MHHIFFVKSLGGFLSETIHLIQQVFVEDAMWLHDFRMIFNRFKWPRISVESEQRCERSQKAQNAAVLEKEENLISKNCLLTIRETAE